MGDGYLKIGRKVMINMFSFIPMNNVLELPYFFSSFLNSKLYYRVQFIELTAGETQINGRRQFSFILPYIKETFKSAVVAGYNSYMFV